MPPNKPAPPLKKSPRALRQAQSKRALLPRQAGDAPTLTTGIDKFAAEMSAGDENPVDEWVPVARVIDAWGLAGWIKLDVFGDTHRSVLGKAKRWRVSPPSQGRVSLLNRSIASDAEYAVTGSRAHGAAWIAQLEAVSDRNQALTLKGYQVAIRRSDFPRLARGEYYWVDLIGCSVFNRDDELLGTVIAMDDHGAHPMLQVQPAVAALDKGIATSARPGSFYIPFVKHFVDRVSIESRRIEVDWLADWS